MPDNTSPKDLNRIIYSSALPFCVPAAFLRTLLCDMICDIIYFNVPIIEKNPDMRVGVSVKTRS